MKVKVECMFLSSNWSGYHPLKVEIWVQIPVGIQHGALDELVKSLAFQVREYGFKSHRHYLIWGMGLLGEDATLSMW